MERTITITKGDQTTKLEILAGILKDFPEDLIERVEHPDLAMKIFGATTPLAQKSFKITFKLEVLKD